MKKALLLLILLVRLSYAYSQACIPVVTGPTTVCPGTVVSYAATTTPITNLTWSINGGGTFLGPTYNPINPQVNWTVPGNWQITVTGPSCPPKIYNVTVVNTTALPPPAMINGPAAGCIGGSSTYTVPTIAGLTTTWSIISMMPPGSGLPLPTLTPSGNQVTVTWPSTGGSYLLSAYYSNGTCSGSQRTIFITSTSGTAQVSINGNGTDAFCLNQNFNFSAYGDPQDTFTWSLPTGGTITPSGNTAFVQWTSQGTHTISVTATNSCGTTRTASRTITVGSAALPAPGAINKQNTVTCKNVSERLSVTAVAGATAYKWQISTPAGTFYASTSTPYVDQTFATDGTVTASVVASNGICDSPSSPAFSFTVGIAPMQTSFPTQTCMGVPTTLSITSNGSLSGYTFVWNVGDGIIIGPANGSSISVRWNTQGSKIASAQVTTPCGNVLVPTPPAFFTPINVQNPNYTLYPISGIDQVCLGEYSYSTYTDIQPVPPNPVGAIPTWTITLQGGGATTGGTIVSTMYTGARISWNTPGNYTVTASVTNACGITKTQSKNVIVASAPKPVTALINGTNNESFCTPSYPVTRTYSVPATAGYTYTWELSGLPGDVLTPSNNTATVSWSGDANLNLFVTPSTAACSGERTYLYSQHSLNSAVGTLSSTGPATACAYTQIPITLSVSSSTGYVTYQVRKKADNGGWSSWTSINSNYTIDYSGFTGSVYTAYYYEFQAVSQNGSCSPAYSAPLAFTGYVRPYLSNPNGYYDPKEICSGSTVSLIPASNTPGTTYNWTTTVSGTITGAPASGTGNISHVLTNTGTSTGTVAYSIIPSANGCSGSTYTTQRYVYATPTVTPNQTKSICSGASVNYDVITTPSSAELNWPDPDGTGPATAGVNVPYYININDVLTNSGNTPLQVTYAVTPFTRITSSFGCPGTVQNVVITVNPKPSMTSPNTTNGCSGIALNHALTATVPSNFKWIAANNANTTGESLSDQFTATINNTVTNSTTVVQPVTYTVTPTSSDGCVGAIQSVVAQINPLPTAVITPASPTTFCEGGSVILNGNTGTGLTYQWIKDNVNIPGATAAAYTATTAGVYKLQVTNSSLCTAVSAPVTVTINPLPSVTVTGSAATFCTGTTVTLTVPAQSGVTYQWFKDGIAISGATSPTLSVTQGGSYTVKKTFTATTCSATSAPTVIIENPKPVVQNVNPTPICSGTTINIPLTSNVTGTTFTWTVPNVSPTLSGVSPGPTVYTSNPISLALYNSSTSSSGIVTIRITPTANGCIGNTKDIIITVNPNITGGVVGSNQSICPSGDPGLFTQTTASTGPAPINYQWQSSTDNVNYSNISGATATTYNAPGGITQTTYFRRATSSTQNSVTCTAYNVVPIVVTVVPLSGGQIGDNQTICSGGNPAPLWNVQSASGIGPVNYQWQKSTNQTTYNSISGATSSTYDPPSGVTQTTYYRRQVSSSVCSSFAYSTVVTVTVETVDASISVSPKINFCPGETINGVLTTYSQPGATYSFKRNGVHFWGGPHPNAFFSQTGSYTVTVTTQLGCSTTGPAVVITQNSAVGTITQTGEICGSGSVSLTAGSGSNYLWSTGATSQTIQVNSTGTYSVNYQNLNGCSVTASSVVQQTSGMGTILQTGELCQNGYVTLTAGARRDVGPDFLWSTGETTQVIFVYSEGNYSVSYFNANGCPQEATTFVANTPTVPGQPCMAARQAKPELEEDDIAEFSIHPNPVRTDVIIQLPEVAKKPVPIVLYDTFGKISYQSEFKAGEKTKTIRTNDFANGVYMLQIMNSKGNQIVRKIIVAH